MVNRFFILFILSNLFIGCQQLDFTGLRKEPEELSDQRFNGKFTLDISSVVYGRGSHTYKFNGTTYAVHESFQYYASGSKLSYLVYEIEVSNNMYRERFWDSEFSNWSEWKNYHFDEDGDLWIDILEYKKEK
jgi:hypothetical protein